MKEWTVMYKVEGYVYARVVAETKEDALQAALCHDVIDYDDMEMEYTSPKVLYSMD